MGRKVRAPPCEASHSKVDLRPSVAGIDQIRYLIAIMLCIRCIRNGLVPLRQSTTHFGRQITLNPVQQSRYTSPHPTTTTSLTFTTRPLSILSRLPTRPLAPTTQARSAIAEDIPTSSFSQTPSSISQQVRGAKRDTFNPSHIVRKRRHGFLSRVRSKNGRKVLKRRRLKGRNTLSH